MSEPKCKWENSCDCSDPNKDKSCQECKWYWMVDSGGGYCKALPEHTEVAWCRDVCSLFKEAMNE